MSEFQVLLDPKELSAVLGGLRLLQRSLELNRVSPEIREILDSGGKELTVYDIDRLCERINLGDE